MTTRTPTRPAAPARKLDTAGPAVTVATVHPVHGWLGVDIATGRRPLDIAREVAGALAAGRHGPALATPPRTAGAAAIAAGHPARLLAVTPATEPAGRDLAGLVVDHGGTLAVHAAVLRGDGTVRYRRLADVPY